MRFEFEQQQQQNQKIMSSRKSGNRGFKQDQYRMILTNENYKFTQ